MKIISYTKKSDMTIEFMDEHKVQRNTSYSNFLKGQVKNPYDRTIAGVGYIGEGKYDSPRSKGEKSAYHTWRDMIERCYNEELRYLHPAYLDCEVCKEWHNFQNFGKWYENNYYEVLTDRLHLDKDILIKGNKLYSPETCVFVPQRINILFIEKPNKHNLPSGINIAQSGKYHVNYNGKGHGNYLTLEEAVAEHDKYKRIHIKELVNQYKDILPQNVKKVLLEW